jgi:formylglycine-generating enzyme required for sulfatase activity
VIRVALTLLAATATMDTVGAGSYRPPNAPNDPPTPVATFRIDRLPVTNAEFNAFVAAYPRWRPGQVPALFADDGYLKTSGAGDAPVTHVSWFAARAYCRARGARLPSEAEWELALAASASDDRRRDPAWQEWVADFSSTMSSADARNPGLEGTCGAGAGAKDPAEYAAYMRIAYRSSLEARFTTANLGFRCAVDMTP